MIVWGTSFGSHDAALAVFDTNHQRVLFASHSERFSKIKDDPFLCQELVDHALEKHGPPSRIFYYEHPWKKKLRYLLSGQWKNLFEESPARTMANLGINVPMVHTDHHLSHAAAGYYTSGFNDAAIVVIDSIGEMATLTVWEGNGSTIRRRYQQNYPHSVGLFYSSMAQMAGLKPNGEEYIFMGMAAWGETGKLPIDLRNQLVDKSSTRLFSLKHNLHRGAAHILPTGLDKKDLAAESQMIYEESLRKVLDWAWLNVPSKNLVLMGGCALNCVANSRISEWQDWNRIWIMPNPGDAGSSLGAALAHGQYQIAWPGPYLGYEISGKYPTEAIITALLEHGIAAVANGKAEFGPRALGNRSILADPRISDMKKRMNWIKKREQFRPFAAVIPEHLASRYFDIPKGVSSPYMQYVFKCKSGKDFPGIAHVDGTSRIQTVNRSQHPALYDLLMLWYDRTGCPMLVNTSLNIKNQPLVNDEKDAQEFQEKYGIPVFIRQ